MPTLSSPDEYREMLRLLRRAREAAGLTQVEVAATFNRHQSVISKIKSGERRIDPVELLRFAELYAVDLLFLFPLPKLRPPPATQRALQGKTRFRGVCWEDWVERKLA